MNAAITAIHYCLPSRRLSNEELEARFDPKALKSIVKMSGIKERRITAPGQTALDLGQVAAERLLVARGVAATTLDMLVFVSQTPDYQIPASACVLHERLKCSDTCGAFDLSLGCSAYPYSLSVVNGLIVSGQAKRVLLVNADALTQVIHPMDRGLVPLHGDGAVATLVEAVNEEPAGLGRFLLGTDGTGYKHLIIPASGARLPRSADTKTEVRDDAGCIRTDEHLAMNGPAVFHFSVYKVPEVIKTALNRFGLRIEDIDLVLLHQANKMMLDLIYRSLGVPEEKRFFFMENVGNMSGASTPMVLAESIRQGKVKPGSRTLLCSFGVGLSWGVAVIEWPKNGIAPVSASVEFDSP
jgi:3-oxoacyl-[acyl-carrier-protein] synthase-3